MVFRMNVTVSPHKQLDRQAGFTLYHFMYCKSRGKGKVHPSSDHEGPERE